MGAGEEQAFKMEYFVYVLGVTVITMLCVGVFRVQPWEQDGNSSLRSPKDSRRQGVSQAKVRNKRLRKYSLGTGLKTQLQIQRKVNDIRTPWGWPRHRELNEKLNGGDQVRPGFSDLMYSFTDRLIRQKELVNSGPKDARLRDSFRALLEDRYHRVNRHSMRSIEYRKVKAPLLRDPNAPHDQMDNFGTGEADRIRRKLPRITTTKIAQGKMARNQGQQHTQLENIRVPWGW